MVFRLCASAKCIRNQGDDAVTDQEETRNDVRKDVRKRRGKIKNHPKVVCTTLLIALIIHVFHMVHGAALEPAQRERRGILNPLCLPISPPGLEKKVEARSGVEPD